MVYDIVLTTLKPGKNMNHQHLHPKDDRRLLLKEEFPASLHENRVAGRAKWGDFKTLRISDKFSNIWSQHNNLRLVAKQVWFTCFIHWTCLFEHVLLHPNPMVTTVYIILPYFTYQNCRFGVSHHVFSRFFPHWLFFTLPCWGSHKHDPGQLPALE